jgi:IS5 family transposase
MADAALDMVQQRDRINAVLAAAGYNFGLLLRWLGELLRACIMALTDASHAHTV